MRAARWEQPTAAQWASLMVGTTAGVKAALTVEGLVATMAECWAAQKVLRKVAPWAALMAVLKVDMWAMQMVGSRDILLALR